MPPSTSVNSESPARPITSLSASPLRISTVSCEISSSNTTVPATASFAVSFAASFAASFAVSLAASFAASFAVSFAASFAVSFAVSLTGVGVGVGCTTSGAGMGIVTVLAVPSHVAVVPMRRETTLTGTKVLPSTITAAPKSFPSMTIGSSITRLKLAVSEANDTVRVGASQLTVAPSC